MSLTKHDRLSPTADRLTRFFLVNVTGNSKPHTKNDSHFLFTVVYVLCYISALNIFFCEALNCAGKLFYPHILDFELRGSFYSRCLIAHLSQDLDPDDRPAVGLSAPEFFTIFSGSGETRSFKAQCRLQNLRSESNSLVSRSFTRFCCMPPHY